MLTTTISFGCLANGAASQDFSKRTFRNVQNNRPAWLFAQVRLMVC